MTTTMTMTISSTTMTLLPPVTISFQLLSMVATKWKWIFIIIPITITTTRSISNTKSVSKTMQLPWEAMPQTVAVSSCQVEKKAPLKPSLAWLAIAIETFIEKRSKENPMIGSTTPALGESFS